MRLRLGLCGAVVGRGGVGMRKGGDAAAEIVDLEFETHASCVHLLEIESAAVQAQIDAEESAGVSKPNKVFGPLQWGCTQGMPYHRASSMPTNLPRVPLSRGGTPSHDSALGPRERFMMQRSESMPFASMGDMDRENLSMAKLLLRERATAAEVLGNCHGHTGGIWRFKDRPLSVNRQKERVNKAQAQDLPISSCHKGVIDPREEADTAIQTGQPTSSSGWDHHQHKEYAVGMMWNVTPPRTAESQAQAHIRQPSQLSEEHSVPALPAPPKLRYFNNGVEVDVNGLPLVQPTSCQGTSKTDRKKIDKPQDGPNIKTLVVVTAPGEDPTASHEVVSHAARAGARQSEPRPAPAPSSKSPSLANPYQRSSIPKTLDGPQACFPPIPKSCTFPDVLAYVEARVPELSSVNLEAIVRRGEDVDALLGELRRLAARTYDPSQSSRYRLHLREKIRWCVCAVEEYKLFSQTNGGGNKPLAAPIDPAIPAAPSVTTAASDLAKKWNIAPPSQSTPVSELKASVTKAAARKLCRPKPDDSDVLQLQEQQNKIWSMFSRPADKCLGEEYKGAPRSGSTIVVNGYETRKEFNECVGHKDSGGGSGGERSSFGKRQSSSDVSGGGMSMVVRSYDPTVADGPHAELIGEIFGKGELRSKLGSGSGSLVTFTVTKEVDPTPSQLGNDPTKIAQASVEELVKDSLKEREKTLSAANVLLKFLGNN